MTNKKMRFRKTIEKDCFSKDKNIYEFDKKIDNRFLAVLREYGEVTVFDDFDIPLIKMDIPGKLRLTALMGSKKITVCFKENAPKGFEKAFENRLNSALSCVCRRSGDPETGNKPKD